MHVASHLASKTATFLKKNVGLTTRAKNPPARLHGKVDGMVCTPAIGLQG